MNPHPMILVVDDDENDRRMTLAALQQDHADLDVHLFRDGAEVLDYLRGEGAFKERPSGHPAMLLLDLNMPRIDGWEVLRRVKTEAALMPIPVVVFTSSSRDHDVEQCYRLGANAYVVKPIDFKEFSEVVHDIRTFWTERNHPPAGSPASVMVSAVAGGPAVHQP